MMNMIKKLNILLLSSLLLFSCKEERLDPTSVFQDLEVATNELDNYIEHQFTKDYNIAIVYKFLESELDLAYNLSPRSCDSSGRTTLLLYSLGIEPHDEFAGVEDFVR